MIAVGPNLFYTVTLPCTLWFLDRRKQNLPPRPLGEGRGEGHGARYRDTVLFIDARHIYRQIDRAHRDWTESQISFLANIVRLYRDEKPDFTLGGDEAKAKLIEIFSPSPAKAGEGRGEGKSKYRDVPGLCKVATIKEIERQGWSLNPGRYVGVAPGEAVSDEDFKEQIEELNEELETLNAAARELEATIAGNVAEILET
jgi:type I restriction enzyme M protein